ncbi:MAG: hypothetical protein V7754_11255 [Halioglobus sp.]
MATVVKSNLSDAPMVTNVISEAFAADPTWCWAIPDLHSRRKYWELLIKNAFRYPYVLRTLNFEAVSVWIPPNCTEIAPEEEEGLPEFVESLVGERSTEVLELLKMFDDNHPNSEPHYYLTLLGTRNKSRGHGLGMKLLNESLKKIDAEKMPVYLESSNPINNERYESVGFVAVNSFQAPGEGPIVTGMWRDSR